VALTTLDPQVRAVIEELTRLGLPPITQIPPPQARQQYRDTRALLRPSAPSVAEVLDLTTGADAGVVPLRLYRPSSRDTLPALIFFHGGGWVVGDLDTHDVICRQIAAQGGMIVIAVDYRLAPEHPFPAAIDDAWAATRWVASHATDLRVDASRLAVGGDSAGGGLAAVVALLARDAGGPALKQQVLIYPVTDLGVEERLPDDAAGYMLTRDLMRWYAAQYAPTRESRIDWRASPLRVPSVERVPPTLLITAGIDPLRAEGEAYARRLEEAGVAVDSICLGGMVHGFLTMGGRIDTANRTVSIVAATLAQALGSTSALRRSL